MSELKFKFEIDSDFSSAGHASESVKKLLKQLDLSPEVIRKTVIAMYEGEINSVIHAGGGVAEVEIASDKIIIILTDKGPGINDIDNAMREGFSTADDNVRNLGFGAGMGLPNMKKYSDEMSVSSKVGEGTTVRLVINY